VTGDSATQSRLKTAVSVLIATVTVIGAVTGWRISVASGAAGAADSRGLEAALHAANTGSSVSTYLSTNLSFFAEYQEHLERATLLERDLAGEPDAARRQSMEDEALRERSLAATARGYVNADYIELDPETGAEYFNGNRFWDAQWAETAVNQTLDPTAAFAEADVARTKTRGLTAAVAGLSFALFLLAAATVAPRRAMQALTTVAIPIIVAACTVVVVLEWRM
jgi:hypothetical protein